MSVSLVVEITLKKIIISAYAAGRTQPEKSLVLLQAEVGASDRAIDAVVTGLVAKNKIKAVSFIIPFGQESYLEDCRVDKDFFKKIQKLVYYFPLQVPCVERVAAYFFKNFKKIPLRVFFGTSFFSQLPKEEKSYALPFEYYDTKKIKKRGYHGIFHGYASCRLNDKKLISLVFDQQTTVCAIKNGKPQTISLGCSPLEGIMSKTSCGDIDPGIVLYLMKYRKFSIFEIDTMLKNQSGFLGLTGYNYDIDQLYSLFGSDDKVTWAFDIYRNQILKYIAEGIAVMGGIEAFCFSGCYTKALAPFLFSLLKGISFLGVHLNDLPWQFNQEPFIVTSEKSPIRVFVNPLSLPAIINLSR